jgi:8-oxo-dGTP diphosphatase
LAINPHISVDIVVFGYDIKEGLKVLLIHRDENHTVGEGRLKLPGNMIDVREFLQDSAYRILKELTGIKNIYLKQFSVFDNPDRLRNGEDLEWLTKTTGTKIERVVTIAYYSLIKIHQFSEKRLSNVHNAKWYKLSQIPDLIFDHNEIIQRGLEELRKEFITEPLCFELLPKKFSLNQLQELSEAILEIKLDNRNFRKKISRLGYIVQLDERQKGVAHKPARFYKFDRHTFESVKKEYTGFII